MKTGYLYDTLYLGFKESLKPFTACSSIRSCKINMTNMTHFILQIDEKQTFEVAVPLYDGRIRTFSLNVDLDSWLLKSHKTIVIESL